MKKVLINKGWYYSAGTKFGWKDKGFIQAGVGINMSFLATDEPNICLVINSEPFILNVAQAKEFIQTFGSIIGYRVNQVGVVSKSLLVRPEEVKETPPPVPSMKGLF